MFEEYLGKILFLTLNGFVFYAGLSNLGRFFEHVQKV